jgi:RimJ/RimL family protein N-acetyltransferase
MKPGEIRLKGSFMGAVQKMRSDMSFLWGFARNREFGVIGKIVKSELWSDIDAVGVSLDLTKELPHVEAQVPLTLRDARPEDLDRLLTVDVEGLEADEREERLVRQHMRKLGFAHCLVAVTGNDEPCYLQWVVFPDENDVLLAAYSGFYPELQPHQALIEGAYTPPQFRGKRIMPAAMSLIAEYARDRGATEVITFVRSNNIASLKGCKRTGFVPSLTRVSSHRFGRRQLKFVPLPPGTPYSFDIASN